MLKVPINSTGCFRATKYWHILTDEHSEALSVLIVGILSV